MNPQTERLEPVTPETPETWDVIEVGKRVRANVGGQTQTFLVERIVDQVVTIRIIDKVAPGKRWNLKKLPYHVLVEIGSMRFRKMGATNKTMKLVAYGAAESPA